MYAAQSSRLSASDRDFLSRALRSPRSAIRSANEFQKTAGKARTRIRERRRCAVARRSRLERAGLAELRALCPAKSVTTMRIVLLFDAYQRFRRGARRAHRRADRRGRFAGAGAVSLASCSPLLQRRGLADGRGAALLRDLLPNPPRRITSSSQGLIGRQRVHARVAPALVGQCLHPRHPLVRAAISGTAWRISRPCSSAKPAPAKAPPPRRSDAPDSFPSTTKKQCFAESFTRSFVATEPLAVPGDAHRVGACSATAKARSPARSKRTKASSRGAVRTARSSSTRSAKCRRRCRSSCSRSCRNASFRPSAAANRLRFRGRVIAATNQPLARAARTRACSATTFYYRLCSDTITVPPLRQRLREDPRELDDAARPHHRAS